MSVTAIFVVLLTMACERTIDSTEPVRSIPESAPVPRDIQVLINSTSVTLDWTVTDSSDIAKYRVYVADTLPVNFRVHDSSAQSTATVSGLLNNRLYYFQVASVDRNGLEGVRSAPVSGTIGQASILINGGASSTTNPAVTIMVSSSVPALMVALSEDPAMGSAVYLSFAPEVSFTLSQGEGVKTVYGRLMFADGSMTGEPLVDTIILTAL